MKFEISDKDSIEKKALTTSFTDHIAMINTDKELVLKNNPKYFLQLTSADMFKSLPKLTKKGEKKIIDFCKKITEKAEKLILVYPDENWEHCAGISTVIRQFLYIDGGKVSLDDLDVIEQYGVKRKNLFQENYELMRRLVPKLIENTNPEFYLTHRINKYKYFLAARHGNDICIDINYYDNVIDTSDVSLYPSFLITLDNEQKSCRLSSVIVFSPSMHITGIPFIEDFESMNNTRKKDNEYSANEYLNAWLKSFMNEKNKSYFEEIVFTK